MKLARPIIIGIIIGGGMILPGVSGGVLAVILGVYERMIDAVAHFTSNIKVNLQFLAPIIIGITIGTIFFGKILFFVFDNYAKEAQYTFIGLIIGGVPALFNELHKREQSINLGPLLISFFFSIILFVLGKNILSIDFSANINNGIGSFFLLFLTGLIFISGKIIPGISSSFMLMLVGMYQFLLNILNDPFNLNMGEYLNLIPFMLGVIIGGIYMIKVIQYLLEKHFSIIYNIIIGFVVGSITAIYPGFSFDFNTFICILLMLIGFHISYKFSISSQNTPKHC